VLGIRGREATNLSVHSGACAPGFSNAGSLTTISDAMFNKPCTKTLPEPIRFPICVSRIDIRTLVL
jgi:hypothetical protein